MAVNLKLRATRVLHGMSQKDMCVLLGLKAEGSYSQKESGNRPFSQKEIEIIANRFNMDGEQIKDIFFNSKLHANEKEAKTV